MNHVHVRDHCSCLSAQMQRKPTVFSLSTRHFCFLSYSVLIFAAADVHPCIVFMSPVTYLIVVCSLLEREKLHTKAWWCPLKVARGSKTRFLLFDLLRYTLTLQGLILDFAGYYRNSFQPLQPLIKHGTVDMFCLFISSPNTLATIQNMISSRHVYISHDRVLSLECKNLSFRPSTHSLLHAFLLTRLGAPINKQKV